MRRCVGMRDWTARTPLFGEYSESWRSVRIGHLKETKKNAAWARGECAEVKPSNARSDERPAWFSFFGFLGAGGRLPKARRGRVALSFHLRCSFHTSPTRCFCETATPTTLLSPHPPPHPAIYDERHCRTAAWRAHLAMKKDGRRARNKPEPPTAASGVYAGDPRASRSRRGGGARRVTVGPPNSDRGAPPVREL